VPRAFPESLFQLRLHIDMLPGKLKEIIKSEEKTQENRAEDLKWF
jgi:hypothetical protein